MDLFTENEGFALRPYQIEAIEKTEEAIGRGDNPLLVMATGTGKTEIFAAIIGQLVSLKQRSLTVAHRQELIDQAIDKIYRRTGYSPSKEKAEFRAARSSLSVVGSVQTLQNSRLNDWPKDHFKLLTVDEAHHACAKTYQNIISHFDPASLLGVTATPDRADEKQLGNIFNVVAYEYNLKSAISDGYLCPIIGKRVDDFDINLEGLKIVAGDYQDGALGEVIEKYVDPIARSVVKETSERKTLLFLPSVAAARAVSTALSQLGLKSAHVDGTFSSKDRQKTLYQFSSGKISHLCSCSLLLEGYDEPSIQAIVMLRPTGSRALYAQCVGRGTRLHPNKDNLLLVEFTFNSQRLRLVTAYELFSQKGFEEKIRTAAESKYDNVEYHNFLDELEETAVNYYKLDRVLNRLTVKTYNFVQFDPFIAAEMNGIDLSGEFDITYKGRKLSGNITSGQIDLLSRYGIADLHTLDKAQASALINSFFKNKYIPMKGEITSGQARFLKGQGHDIEGMKKAQASVLISKIKEAQECQQTPETFGSKQTSMEEVAF